ncbi:serine/threonine-protein kinase [Nocardia iowensis]|uniref:Serine/threonine protein kinase n=1 Tax=Nocardia iowensis TaxID=204891 RepID=A0ABX8RYZ6_NOCIO|nr:serine/threonine-protein kinase [Nocardia iowensis]QXN94878.1 serine/threonine protein kinase [Nocardia iowensis]
MRPLGAEDPTRIGDYRLLGVLGAGGMGRVYLGRNAGGRTVAVKVIRPDLIGDTEFRVRFRREVSAARRVGGQFTAPVLDADADADPPWLATGYVAGFSLAEAVEAYGPFTENSLLVLAHGLAEALVAVHAAGLVHRDLKPSNVLLALDGPKVIDFGIARALDDSKLTTTGKVIGSPGFMCPEQVTGDPVGPASDVFALGGVLAFAATGRGPFGVGEMVQLLWRVVYEEPRLDDVPHRLRPLIAACLTKDPAARPSPERLITDLTVLGIPERGGWLPGPALEEVSRRAVQLLDLDSGPLDVPGAIGRPVTDPARTAETIAGPNARIATSLPGSTAPATVQQDVAPRSWHGAPDTAHPSPRPPGHLYSHGPHNGSYATPDAHRSAHPAQQPARRPTRRRAALIAGALALCIAVAVAAFVITTKVTGDSGGSTARPDAPASDSTTELPNEFVGEWKGVAEDKLGSYDIVLVLHSGAVGQQVGSSSNTGNVVGVKCGRLETLTAAAPTEIALTAQLAEDGGLCNDDGAISQLQLQPDSTIAYRTRGVGGDMTGILTQTN